MKVKASRSSIVIACTGIIVLLCQFTGFERQNSCASTQLGRKRPRSGAYGGSSSAASAGRRVQPVVAKGKDANLAIRTGTVAYLVMGQGDPPLYWLLLGRKHHDVYIIYLSWQTAPKNASDSLHFHRYHIDGESTWATGRNRLLNNTKALELQQGWCFEYLIFADEDVRMLVRYNNGSYIENSSEVAEAEWRAMLLRDRPARAGVVFPGYREWFPSYPTQCKRNCHYDNCLDAFHRTAVDVVLPYPTQFDEYNWWMASEMVSLRSAALLSEHCNLYHEVSIDPIFNTHGGYVASSGFKKKVVAQYFKCLAEHDISSLAWMEVFAFGVGSQDGDIDCKKAANRVGVDFAQNLTEEKWLIQECNKDTRFDLKNAA